MMVDEIYVKDVRRSDQLQGWPLFLTFDQLQRAFGMQVVRSQGWDAVSAGEACWKLVGFFVTSGPAEFRPMVLDANNDPLEKIIVFRSWPDIDGEDKPIRPNYSHNGQYVYAWTKADGSAGMPYFSDNVVKNGKGVDRIWVSASPPGEQPQFSDAVFDLGWMGGTDHMTANPVFKYTVRELPLPPGPAPDPDPDPDPGPGPIIIPPSEDTHTLQVVLDDQVISFVKFKVTTTLEVID